MPEQKVKDLKQEQRKVNLLVKIEEISETRKVTAKTDSMFHNVADVLCGDETGCIYLSVWDEQIKELKKWNYYSLENAYTAVYRGSLRLNLGKYGKIREAQAGFEVDTSNNISLKELEE